MLERISVKNLGCFDDAVTSVDFSQETLLAGPNNSGKSMLLAAMNLARYFSVTGALNWDTEFFNLHSFDAAVNAHDTKKVIDISFKLKDKTGTYDFNFTFPPDQGIALKANNESIRPGDPRYIDILQRIWCLRPNRSPLPYQTRVQPTSGLLQPLKPNGLNVINYLLERWTDRDKKWNLAESWLRRIDPDMSELKTPIRGDQVFLETISGNVDVNASLQGSGFQSAAAIISAVIFSPEGSTLIIEEPEAFLHPKSQEVIVDMINEAVNKYNKQVIFSTHSCNVLLPFYNDCGSENARMKRGADHVIADASKFAMWTFEKAAGRVSVKNYPMKEKTFKNFRDDFKYIWG
jgi:predicted ATPase